MKKQFTIRVTKTIYDNLQELGIKEDRSMNNLVVLIITRYLNNIK